MIGIIDAVRADTTMENLGKPLPENPSNDDELAPRPARPAARSGPMPKQRTGSNTKERYKSIPGARMTKKRTKRSPKRGRK